MAQTTTDNVSKLFRDGLAQLINPSLLSTAIDNSNGSSRPLNATYNFDFNHERGPNFVTDNYRLVVARYETRIFNIQKIASHHPTVYVHFTERDGDLLGLIDAVRSFDTKDLKIIIIDSWSGNRTTLPDGRFVRYKRFTFPSLDYRWFIPDHYESKEGYEFERKVADFILDAMIDLSSGSVLTKS